MKLTLPLLLAQVATLTSAQTSCRAPSGNIRPSVASGYALQVAATGLGKPRGLAIDSQGHLLAVEQTSGIISAHVVSENNGCVTLGNSTTVVARGLTLNHGIWVNGTTLYASNSDAVYSWTYDPATRSVTNQQQLIRGMNNTDHSTRTLFVSQYAPGMIVVSRGSTSNLDPLSTTIEGGTAQVRAFNLNNRTGVYNWQDGILLAWGVRNEVGIAEHPNSGRIYGVENSADQIHRAGVDVSNNNPGEELNFFGYLNGTRYQNQGKNFGYPYCLSVWNTTDLPNNQNLTVGSQFAFDSTTDLNNGNRSDTYCETDTVSPRLVFQAHMAPLDIKFNNSGTEGWITFHGSWNRQVPVGYKLSVVQFNANGEPVQPSNSTTAAIDIVSNQNDLDCPNNCFRPVAMAFDTRGRIFMSSDSTGEIYLVTKNAASNGTNGTAPAASRTGGTSASSTGTSEAPSLTRFSKTIWGGLVFALAVLIAA